MQRKEIFENNDLDFEIIRRALSKHGKCAFDYSPEGCSRFGIVLTSIRKGEKITNQFSGLHPVLEAFIFVSISRVGSFGFNFGEEEPISTEYIEEKLRLSMSDAEGIAALINYVLCRGKAEK